MTVPRAPQNKPWEYSGTCRFGLGSPEANPEVRLPCAGPRGPGEGTGEAGEAGEARESAVSLSILWQHPPATELRGVSSVPERS